MTRLSQLIAAAAATTSVVNSFIGVRLTHGSRVAGTPAPVERADDAVAP